MAEDQKPTSDRSAEEEHELVTAGEEVSDEFGIEQPTGDDARDEGASRAKPTPNPDQIAP